MNRRARGQTLVLFSLTLLLLVVMVCLTLAIGMRVREKIELQTLADATAYSNAVATARVYNTLSVWSRAQVSTLVVLAGAQSHVSYAGWYLGGLRATAVAAAASATACTAAAAVPGAQCLSATCLNVGRIAEAFNQEYDQQLDTFRQLDGAAGLEVRALQGKAAAYGAIQLGLLGEHALFVGRNGFAQKVLELAVPDERRRREYDVGVTRSGAAALNASELKAALAPGANAYPALPMAHGSRESAFLRNRELLIPPARPITLYLQNQGIGGYWGGDGSAYFGTGRHGVAAREKANESWADDDAVPWGGVVFGGCPWSIVTLPTHAHVRSTHDANDDDQHAWFGGSPHDGSVASVHTLGSCGDDCPSVWVLRAQYNLDPDDADRAYDGKTTDVGLRDQWRQPKNYAAFERDYTARTVQDPWNLMFRFRVRPDGDAGVDLGQQATMTGAHERQLALATGITYYHRHLADRSWEEPPNFFNPFWRATLVPADIDQPGALDGELDAVLTPAGTTFEAAHRALRAAGFRGIQ